MRLHAAITRTRLGAFLCLMLMTGLAIATVVLFDLSIWIVITVVILLCCPIVMGWTYIMGMRPLPFPVGPVPQTRGRTLNWLAPYYDGLCRLLRLGPSFREQTLAVAALRPGEHILDVGCGTGVLTTRAAEVVGSTGAVWGIDAAADMIRLARQRAANLYSKARFEPGVIEDLPFDDASMNVAFASLVLHHLPTELKRQGLGEIYRVLRPEGRFIVVDLDYPAGFFLRLILQPLCLLKNFRDHVAGRLPSLIREAGFRLASAERAWGGVLTIWSARKPALEGLP